jgi:uncharacterized protein (DUF433 family)
MTAIEQARSALNQLSISEQQELLEEIAHKSLEIAPRIFRTFGVSGGDPCIRRTRIPVWLLEEGRRNGASDSQLLDSHPQLDAEDLSAAWAYVREHRAEIDKAISENADG